MEFKAIFPTAVASSSVMFSDTKVSSKLDLGIVTVCRGRQTVPKPAVQWTIRQWYSGAAFLTTLNGMEQWLHRQLVVIIGRRIDNFREGREIHKQQEVYLPEFHVRELGKQCIVSQVVRPDKVDDYMVLIVELGMGASCGCPAESLTAKGSWERKWLSWMVELSSETNGQREYWA
ncbi:hypothetical protein B0H14DRAFT_2596846 [Mycena olivaceomarginata]|nr:hypothetical protein B0H14DRAFT_2596846 [Mycena olivaceomarginata]